MSLTLFINKSDSRCECHYSSVDPMLKVCPRCNEKWDTVSSDYAGGGIAHAATKMRPDLEPHFPWEDWWNSEKGQKELAAFRTDVLGIDGTVR